MTSAYTTSQTIKPREIGSERVPIFPRAMATVSPALYDKFQRLIYAEAGIWLGPSKTALLCGRLSRRLRALQIDSLEEYFQRVTRPEHRDEFILMIDAITTNETHFFREPKHFEFLTGRLFPRWRSEAEAHQRPRKLRIWSAGCSSGEEPYSLAMVLLRHFPAQEGWDVKVSATDISTQVLTRAKAGVYSLDKAREIPADLLRAFVLQGTGDHEGSMKMAPELQHVVEFQRLNLNQAPYPVDGPFDAIFCRNVLIYFDVDSKRKVVDALTGCLAGKGLFFVGHAENLNGVSTRLRTLSPTIYGHIDDRGQLIYDFRNPVRAETK